MSKINCVNCKYYDFNDVAGVDWCRLDNDETGICGYCDREFEDLEEAIVHYDALVKENNTFLMYNSEMAGKIKDYEQQIADLEAKLAESEKSLEAKESVNQLYMATLSLKDSDFNDLVRKNAQLKQQLAITEKALELCERHHIGFENATLKEQVDWREDRVKENIKYFINKAKETKL